MDKKFVAISRGCSAVSKVGTFAEIEDWAKKQMGHHTHHIDVFALIGNFTREIPPLKYTPLNSEEDNFYRAVNAAE